VRESFKLVEHFPSYSKHPKNPRAHAIYERKQSMASMERFTNRVGKSALCSVLFSLYFNLTSATSIVI